MNNTNQPASLVNFRALDRALDFCRALPDLLEQIARRDRDLERQLRKAAASVPLNLGEGRRRAGKDRLHHYRIAAGSCEEAWIALEVAVRFRYVPADAIAEAKHIANHILAMTHKLTR